jgi:uncharacterized lipoprotein YbaY
VTDHDDRLVRRVVQAAAGRGAAVPCPDAEVLGLYAERALGEDERAGVEGHVAGCARCQAVLVAFVRSAPEGAGGGVAGGVIAATGAGDVVRAWWAGWRWMVPVAATAAVVSLAVWVQRRPVPEMAAVEEQRAAAAAPAPGGAATEPGGPQPAPRVDAIAKSRAVAPALVPERRAARQAAPAQLAGADAAKATTLADARGSAPAAAPVPPAALGSAAQVPASPATVERQESAPAGARVAEATGAMRAAEVRGANRADASAMARAKAEAGQRMVDLTGRVTYRTRAALPAGAVIEVRLLDVSRSDAPAELMGRVEIVTRGEQVPVPFVVRYDADALDPRHRYSVQATITIDGRVAYRTTTAHAVLTSGEPATNVEVVVQEVR